MDALIQTFRNLGPMRLAIMAVVLFLMVGFFVFLATRFSSPQMGLLYGNLETQDQSAIIVQLQASKIPYELRSNGKQIFVPKDQVAPLRMQMANQGLPSGGSVGYEIFDKQSSLGTTTFQQNINKLRAMEGELERTIQSLDAVRQARVQLVLPTRALFQRRRTKPTASVFLRMRGGQRLDPQQVRAIQHLVASAVPDLLPRNIAIIDDKGDLLARGYEGDAATSPGLIAQRASERRLQFEQRMDQTIETLLDKTAGYGKVRAEVNADMDFDRVTTNEEIFNPDGQVVRNTQTIEQNRASQNKAPSAVTVGANLPDPTNTAGNAATRNSTDSRTEENVNYEISKKVINKIRSTGVINRLSVAVLIDGTYKKNAKGDRVYQPRSAKEMKLLTSLVKSAIGFNKKRGDTVEVVNMRFPGVEFPPAPPLNLFFGLEKQDLLQIAEMLVVLILAVLVILLVVRPLISRAFEALPTTAEALVDGGRMIADQAQLAAGALAAPPSPDGAMSDEDLFEELIDIDRVEGRVKASSVKKVGEIVDKHPEEALSIIRNWLYQET